VIGGPLLRQTPLIGQGRFVRPRSMEIGPAPARILSSNKRRLGAYIFNNGSQLEFPIPLPGSNQALALAKVLDSAGIPVPPPSPSTYKSAYLQVDTALAWVTGAQPTIQLLVGRQSWGPLSGATTQAGTGAGAFNAAKNAVANLGPAAATSLAVGIWPFSPADLADLQWHHPYIGFELTFGSALTAGAARLFLQMPGGAALYLGEEATLTSQIGDRGVAWPLLAQTSPLYLQDSGELWAVAGPGGIIDCRIWEVWDSDPGAGEPGI